ncbi:hypothetical protein KCU65_g6783, partial [Aureobasidium melanogenum]
MSSTDSDSHLLEQPSTDSIDSGSTLLEHLSRESIDSKTDLPEYPFNEEQRRYLRIVNQTTPLSDIIRAQALRPSRPPKRRYLTRLTSISESISESQYSGVTDYFEEARVSRSQSITLPNPIQDYFVPTTNPPSLPGDKVKTRTKIYRGLARFFNQSSTSLAELSSATKDKLKDFKLARSKSTFNLPGLVSPPSSPSSSITTTPPPRLAQPNSWTLPTSYSESALLMHSAETLPIEPPSKWTRTRRSLRAVPQRQERLNGTKSPRTRSSSGHWSSSHRSTTDANGSPAAPRLHAMNSSKASPSPQSSNNFDPTTPPPPTLQSPHVFKPVVPPSTPTGSSHLLTPVTAAASSTSKSAHNFKPVVIHKSQSPNSQHNFKPVIINNSQSPKSPHNFKPIIVDDLAIPTSPHTFTPIQAAPSPSLNPFRKFKSNAHADPDINAGFSFCIPASAPVYTEPSPVAPKPSEADPSRPLPFKTRYQPYVPRPYDEDEEVTFPNGLDGDNPYKRPYGGGGRNDAYHLHERLTTAQLLVDPYAKPPKPTKKPKKPKKESNANHYGGRSASQRESTRYVHRVVNGGLYEEYEMDDLSPPSPKSPNIAPETAPDESPKPFVGTAATILQRVRKNLKITHVKAYDPASNVYFYEKAYVPRFTKHSLRPSKRMFSIRNFLNRRLYGRPGDGTNLLMPHIPFEVKIPGVDKEDKAEPEAEPDTKKKENPFAGHRNFLDDEWKAQLKEAQAARKANQKKRARELKKKRKEERKARGHFYSFRQHLEEQKLARAKRNYEKDVEEEARKERMKAPEPSFPPDDLLNGSEPELEPVERQDFAFAQDAYEKQRAIALKEARSGKKKVSFPDLVSNYTPRPEDLRHDFLRDRDPADIDVGEDALSTDDSAMNLVPRFRLNSPSTSSLISHCETANHSSLVVAIDPANDPGDMAKNLLRCERQLHFWKTGELLPEEADDEETRQRDLKAENIAVTDYLKKYESTPEKPVQPMAAKTPRHITTESLGITPPRLRTPDRYKSYTFEEAEQLVTPKSPQQCQFEEDQAASHHSPKPYQLPSVEEEIDSEDEKHIAHFSNAFREFL